jgi:hypothetical protein
MEDGLSVSRVAEGREGRLRWCVLVCVVCVVRDGQVQNLEKVSRPEMEWRILPMCQLVGVEARVCGESWRDLRDSDRELDWQAGRRAGGRAVARAQRV